MVGLDSLHALEELVARRSAVAAVYSAALGDRFVPQRVREGDRHSWVHWTGQVGEAVDRERLAEAIAAEGIATKPYYEHIVDSGRLPVSSALHARALALPMSSELTTDDAERVATGVRRALRRLA